MKEGFSGITREKKDVEGGFGVEVVDGDEVLIVVDYLRRRVGLGRENVGAQTVTA